MAVKTETVTIKVTPEQKEQIRQKADEKDMTVSKYLHRIIFKKEDNQMTIEEMINELKHYTNTDLYDCSINQIVEMYCNLFGEEA